MRNKLYSIFEYAYIAMAAFSIYQVFILWKEERGRAYMFVFFAVVAVFMFFFKRKFRNMMKDRDNNQNQK